MTGTNSLRIIEAQDEIIRLQSGIIKEMHELLLMHLSPEEAEQLPFHDRHGRVELLKKDIE